MKLHPLIVCLLYDTFVAELFGDQNIATPGYPPPPPPPTHTHTHKRKEKKRQNVNTFLLGLVCFKVVNATFNNISVISWRSVLLVGETGVSGEHHRPVASH